ncbi:MAG: hyaC [Firmicutes bacterium]|nr:hyaC [Bacillota bacterium]
MERGHSKQYYVFSPFLRIFHWLMVLSIVTLFTTGLYIGDPFFIGSQGLEPTYAVTGRLSMEIMRFIHFAAAYIFTVSFILRAYGFWRNKGDRLFPHFWKKQYYEDLLDVFLHYTFIKSSHKPCLRNPLARASYVALYFMVFIEIITGFAMYTMIKPNSWGAKIYGPVNQLLGDEYTVHIIHHYVAWLIILFAIVHVYMAARADFMDREGEISSMFSGVKFLPHEPVDIGDITDGKDSSVRDRKHSITG